MNSVLKNKRAFAVFLTPAMLIYSAIVFVPIIYSGYYSLFKWDGLSEMKFIGLDNYITLFTKDRVIWPILVQTIEYTLLQILFQVGGGLILALLLTLLVKKRAIFQTVYYIPVVISSVAICQIFDKIFSVTPTGLVNHLLSLVNENLAMTEWLTTPGLSLVITAFAEGYKTMGVYMVTFFAALIGVPGELSEAAKVDGASWLRTVWHIRLPYIRPIIVANMVLVLNNSIRSFDFSFMLTAGGPGTTSELLASYMYKKAFSSMQYGYGSTLAVFIIVICFILASFCMKQFDRGGESHDQL